MLMHEATRQVGVCIGVNIVQLQAATPPQQKGHDGMAIYLNFQKQSFISRSILRIPNTDWLPWVIYCL